MNARRRRGAKDTKGPARPWAQLSPQVVWVDGWQYECCGDSIGVGDEVDLAVTEPHLANLRSVLGDAADAVDAAEERHDGPVRTVSGRVGRVEAVRTQSRPEEPGSKIHVYEPSTMRREEVATMADVAPHTPTGFLVEVLPPYAALVWLDDALEFAVGDDVMWPTTGPDPAVVRPVLGHRARAVTHRVELRAEPLKLRKVAGTVARIEAVYFAVMCDDDAEGWAPLPGSAQWIDVKAVPGSSSPDGWRDHVAHLVTLL